MQVINQVERRKVRDDQVGAVTSDCGLSAEKLSIVTTSERDTSGFDEVSAIRGKELAHFRVHIICLHCEATFGEKPRVNSRSCTEVEKRGTWRCNSQNKILERRARATIRFP